MKIRLLILTLLTALSGVVGFGQTYAPSNYVIVTTVAGLPPATSIRNVIWIVKDGSTSSDCTTGGGGNFVLCSSNGLAWTGISIGGGGSPVTWPATGSIVVSNGTNSPTGIPETDGLCVVGAAGAWGAGACSGAAATAFSAITGSTNTTAAMVVGTGASISVSGSGTNAATSAPLAGISGLGAGVATFLGTPSSANLAAAVTDETGTGALVFGTAPTITLTNGTGLPISTGVSGLGTGVATFLATPTSANFAAAVTGETGTGALVFGTSPTLASPAMTGTATAVNLTVSGTCTGCGSGSTGISGLTANFIPKAGSSTTLTANSAIDDGVTTASTITISEPVNIATGASTGSLSLGTDGTGAGTLVTSNGSSAAHTTWGSAATTSNTILGFATAPTTGHLVGVSVSGTTITLTDGGAAGGGTTTNPLTMNNGGSGVSSGTTFDGSAARTLSYNTLGAPGLAASNSFTASAAASTPAAIWTSAPFAGTGTTATPVLYFNAAVTQPTTWATSGTFLGFNAPNAYAGNFMDMHVNGGGSLWKVSSTGTTTALKYNSNTACAGAGTAANPSVVTCSAAPMGFFSCATAASGGTCTVNTTAVTANSIIQVQPDSSLGTALSVTCNTTADSGLTAPRISARTAATSFTITLGTFTTSPECYSYVIFN